MSELVVGSIAGLPSNDYVVDVAAGSTLDLSAGAVFPSGSVIQVVSTTKTDTFSASVASAGSIQITGLSATITPISSSSKILVMANVNGSATNGYGIGSIILDRDGTAIGIGDSAGSRSLVSSVQNGAYAVDINTMANITTQHFDSPSTTSAVTYNVYFFNTASATQTVNVNRTVSDTDTANRPRTASSITLMEVAG